MSLENSWVDRKIEASAVISVGASAPTSVATPTGTATRTTFDTTTVTAAQLAERVFALIQDLRTAGVIK